MAVHLLGIRHHGPGSARAVVRALDEIRPTIVLVEAPADAAAALAWIGRPGLRPPVALLGHVVAAPRRAAFAPFARFSPEWQAIAWAHDRGVEMEPIDLPMAQTLAVDDEPDLLGTAPPDPIAALAAAAGDADPERWWDDVIEHRGDGVDAFAAVAEAMAAVRAGSVAAAGEERREAHMRRRIRASRRTGHDVIAVVCGAWHVPALDVDGGAVPGAGTDAATLRGRPRTKVGISWVPWTHERLAAATGYAAGVRSPGWYDHVFAHPGADGVARFFVEAARVLRAEGLPASPDHLIGATRLASSLAGMRGRPRPGLDEVLDAADAVMGGLPLVRRHLVVGDALGAVPDGAPQVPLARDLAARQRSARLRPQATEQVVELDLRTPNGRRRSHLLHQVAALGIGWGRLEDGRGSSGTFRETWRLRWDPDAAVRVVERASDGTTLVDAATHRLVARARHADALVGVADALDRALLADLPDAIDPITSTLAVRAAHDTDVAGLARTLAPLANAHRYGDVRSTDAAAVAAVFDGIAVRVLAGLPLACASLDDDAAATMAELITQTRQALALVEHPARASELPRVLATLSERAGHGVVQGRATRLLHDGGHWPSPDVEARLSRALSGGTPPAVGAAFVEGFVAGSGTVLVHDAELLGVIDAWVASLPHDAFVETVPLLRRTFGSFEAAERRQLGRLVAGGEVEPAAGFGAGVDPARAAAALRTARTLLGLPVDRSPEAVG